MPYIISRFTEGNVGKIGLSPTIDIINVATDTTIISGAAMIELGVGDGLYQYNFTAYDKDISYLFRTNGNDSDLDNQIQIAGNERVVADLTSDAVGDLEFLDDRDGVFDL